jgi:hypothetical protein
MTQCPGSIPALADRESPDRLQMEVQSRLERIEHRLDRLLEAKTPRPIEAEARTDSVDWTTMSFSADHNPIATFSYGIMGRPTLKFENPIASGIVSQLELRYAHERWVDRQTINGLE